MVKTGPPPDRWIKSSRPKCGTYGTVTIYGNGDWTYSLDDSDPDTEALTTGVAAIDRFT